MYQRVMAIIGIISDYLADEIDLFEQEDEIVDDLVSLGFDFPEIETAFGWIANLSQGKELNLNLLDLEPESEFQRHFSLEERQILSLPARTWLSKLRQLEIVDQVVVEDIFDQAILLGGSHIGLEDVKVIATMVIVVGRLDPIVRERFLDFLENDREIVFH
jgi:uncharacterized protein Smg (DUF494 family)